ncbi:MAG: DUF4832 domain-containing protein [Lentisphaerae bacterium]|jgi:hypothetical protein|nr:DUF4832 domain-containing protein [Lentisphaerota bacterium]MBT4815202.1 DUF4832 domain-containing protein [Lentisphaerota bacterium]MBT5609180.1 DUF4832 domain-containing protein [Lentisphaerota bacterium]MBT7053616.1 DUF4832 domain-containing protein [Lentisphaerota bacterium]MBT7845725.1 DUF4832 domain-containing protein [Lentisphaerota bacterium]
MARVVCWMWIIGAMAVPLLSEGGEMRTVSPPAYGAPIFNLGMGLYLQHPPMDSGADEWYMQIGDIAYYRLHWADVNPEEGVYTFDEYFGPKFDVWVKQHGKRVAFGVMSQSKHGRMRYVTPKWVYDKGVPGVVHYSNYFKDDQVNPVFWDERYLDDLEVFTAKLGEYLDGRQGLEFMDMRGIGEWGELHLQRWTPKQLEETGFTHEAYVLAYRRMVDAFACAFPGTHVFLNVGGQKHHTINDYAALRGIHFRQDGLKPGGASYNCGEWLFKPYSRQGVLCNFEFHSSYSGSLKKGWSAEATIEACLAAPISYLNTGSWLGGGGLRDAPEDAKRWLSLAASRLGYRLRLAELQVPETFSLREGRRSRIPLRQTWVNEGLAPCPESFAVEWSLHRAADGEVVASQLQFPSVPTSNWEPGTAGVEAASLFSLPGETPVGDYQLKVAVVCPETGRKIALAMGGKDAAGRYEVCSISGVPATGDGGGDVYVCDFGSGPDGWTGTAGMTIKAATDGRSGNAMRIAGKQESGWNYAAKSLDVPLVLGGRYKLTVWMCVDQINTSRHPPFVKLGVYDVHGNWLDNYGTAKYNLTKVGTWQELVGFADLPAEAVRGNLAVEKGVNAVPIQVDLRLDDVRLELIEAP